MQVSEVMHKGIISVDINESIKKVAQIMRSEDIGSIPVMDHDTPVGFVTDRDIVITCVAEGHSPTDPVSHAMCDELITIHQDEDVQEATRLMQENQISRIVVVDSEKRPVGMLSLKDFTKAVDSDLNVETFSRIKE